MNSASGRAPTNADLGSRYLDTSTRSPVDASVRYNPLDPSSENSRLSAEAPMAFGRKNVGPLFLITQRHYASPSSGRHERKAYRDCCSQEGIGSHRPQLNSSGRSTTRVTQRHRTGFIGNIQCGVPTGAEGTR